MKKSACVLFIVLLAVTVAEACNIPVFRFALERWPPDSCELVIFRRAPLTPDQQQQVDALQAASMVRNGSANIKVTDADVNRLTNETLSTIWTQIQQDATTEITMPFVVARTRLSQGRIIQHWKGSLQQAASGSLLNSPVRQALAERLQAGDSVVWLLLKSDDKKKTEAARSLMAEQLQLLPRKLSLPDGVGLPGSELYSDVPLLLKFTMIEIDPNDSREQFLVQLLSGLQAPSFKEGEPLIVPVFGRGRALEVIPADQLNAELVSGLTEFLCGACSCQVKELNPGFDLLISTEWNRHLFGDDSAPPASETGPGQQRSQKPELLTIPPGKKNRN